MAELKVTDTELLVELTAFERLEAVHGDVRVPLSAVRSVDVVDDALDAVHGIRTGTGLPGVLVIGTIRWAGKKSFVVVHRGHPRGVIVHLVGVDFDELVVGVEHPEAVAAQLSAQLGSVPPA